MVTELARHHIDDFVKAKRERDDLALYWTGRENKKALGWKRPCRARYFSWVGSFRKPIATT